MAKIFAIAVTIIVIWFYWNYVLNDSSMRKLSLPVGVAFAAILFFLWKSSLASDKKKCFNDCLDDNKSRAECDKQCGTKLA